MIADEWVFMFASPSCRGNFGTPLSSLLDVFSMSIAPIISVTAWAEATFSSEGQLSGP